MRYAVFIGCMVGCLQFVNTVGAQTVLYSPAVSNGYDGFEVIGRVGSFYWVQYRNGSGEEKRGRGPSAKSKERLFEVYDLSLNRVKELAYSLPDTVVKEYLVAGDHYFDQLLLTASPNETAVLLNRYAQDGSLTSKPVRLLHFPSNMGGDDFLLVRSQDKTKILLLGFEPVENAPPRIHAILYNSNWKVLTQSIHEEGRLAQPFTQYEFTNYPLEHFDNSPVKVADNGDWLMVAPSRLSNTYLLCHFGGRDSSFIQKEIRQTQGPAVKTTTLSLDNKSGEALAALLVNTGFSSLKKIHLARYRLGEGRLDFDTTYRFPTAARLTQKDEHLFEQDLVPVRGKGFLYLKEYGRPFVSDYVAESRYDEDETPLSTTNSETKVVIHKKDYTRFGNWQGAGKAFERGDLSLYYFPAQPNDSCWSGLINIKQTTELNAAYLSYVCLPVAGKILFLYNSLSNNQTKYSSATVLDEQGNTLNEGLVFWRSGNVLDFQKTRQIGGEELAIPYRKNRLQGFAIIRL